MPNIVREKSFAVRVVALCKMLRRHNEFVLSRQLLRSGTAIGALVREAEHAESRSDFVHKMSIALKEANETAYWLDLLHETQHVATLQFVTMRRDVSELLRILARIVKSARQRTERHERRSAGSF